MAAQRFIQQYEKLETATTPAPPQSNVPIKKNVFPKPLPPKSSATKPTSPKSGAKPTSPKSSATKPPSSNRVNLKAPKYLKNSVGQPSPRSRSVERSPKASSSVLGAVNKFGGASDQSSSRAVKWDVPSRSYRKSASTSSAGNPLSSQTQPTPELVSISEQITRNANGVSAASRNIVRRHSDSDSMEVNKLKRSNSYQNLPRRVRGPSNPMHAFIQEKLKELKTKQKKQRPKLEDDGKLPQPEDDDNRSDSGSVIMYDEDSDEDAEVVDTFEESKPSSSRFLSRISGFRRTASPSLASMRTVSQSPPATPRSSEKKSAEDDIRDDKQLPAMRKKTIVDPIQETVCRKCGFERRLKDNGGWTRFCEGCGAEFSYGDESERKSQTCSNGNCLCPEFNPNPFRPTSCRDCYHSDKDHEYAEKGMSAPSPAPSPSLSNRQSPAFSSRSSSHSFERASTYSGTASTPPTRINHARSQTDSDGLNRPDVNRSSSISGPMKPNKPLKPLKPPKPRSSSTSTDSFSGEGDGELQIGDTLMESFVNGPPNVLDVLKNCKIRSLSMLLPAICNQLVQTPLWLEHFKRSAIGTLKQRAQENKSFAQTIHFMKSSGSPEVYNLLCGVPTHSEAITFFQELFIERREKGFEVEIPSHKEVYHPLKDLKIHKLRVEHVFNSNARPLLVTLFGKNAKDTVIFKYGDDLRQDVACLQLFRLLNQIWESERQFNNLSMLQARVYACIAMDSNFGCIEYVEDCFPIQQLASKDIQFDRDELRKVISTAAGSYIASWILGIRDRHDDNTLITKTGCLFHVDFSHILGTKVTVDTADFAITKDLKTAMGPRWTEFVATCIKAFVIIRKHHSVIMNYAWNVLGHLYTHDRITAYLTQTLMLNDELNVAVDKLTQAVMKAPSSYKTKFKNALHHTAQALKKEKVDSGTLHGWDEMLDKGL